jgi:hypothetical protein
MRPTQVLWVIEEYHNGRWDPADAGDSSSSFRTRKAARFQVWNWGQDGAKFRIRKYEPSARQDFMKEFDRWLESR